MPTKQNNILTTLKSGMKSKPILSLLVIIVVLVFLNVMQSCSAKKNYATLSLKKSELKQCQMINDDNSANVISIEQELNRCVGIRQLMENKLFIAEVELKEFSERIKGHLNERIKTIETLPDQDCDDVAVDDDVVKLWMATPDSQD